MPLPEYHEREIWCCRPESDRTSYLARTEIFIPLGDAARSITIPKGFLVSTCWTLVLVLNEQIRPKGSNINHKVQDIGQYKYKSAPGRVATGTDDADMQACDSRQDLTVKTFKYD